MINRKGVSTTYKFFLFNDLLIYASNVSEKKYKMHQEIEINRTFNISIPESNEVANSFIIHNDVKTFKVVAPSAGEWETWQKHLDLVIAQADVSLLSRRYSTGVKPMFVADTEAKECWICEKVFTTLNRRHHCRSCGKVICGSCSKERLNLDNFTEVAQRVCTQCHAAAQADAKYEAELKQSSELLYKKMQLQQEKIERTKETLKL